MDTPAAKRPERLPSRYPPAVEKNLRKMDPYRGFVAGQRDKSRGKDEGMAEYLGEWERG